MTSIAHIGVRRIGDNLMESHDLTLSGVEGPDMGGPQFDPVTSSAVEGRAQSKHDPSGKDLGTRVFPSYIAPVP